MENKNEAHIKLTSAEISSLWSAFLGDSMTVCVLKYFLQHIEDLEIKSLLNFALERSQEHIEIIEDIFITEGIPVPQGFTESDMNLRAKRLFSDKFYLYYLKQMAKGGLVSNGRIVSNIYRSDILSYFSKCLTTSLELNNKVTEVLLEKGLAIRPPYIQYHKEVEFAQKQSFIWEGLGKRPITGLEATTLYANIQTNQLGSSLAVGFSQVAQSKKVKDFFIRGREISLKHIRVFSDYLTQNYLPIPMAFDQEVTDSKEAPFSDKLMTYHFNMMIVAGIANYGAAISESQRSDFAVDYSRLIGEVLKYEEDGVNIMIANQWLEQPPLALNRKDLAKD